MSLASRDIRWGEMQGIRKFETPQELSEEYRSFLTKLLYVQADTEFASVQQHRPWLDRAPTVEDRWIESRILCDEMRHGWQMCKLLSDFGQEGKLLIDDLMARREHQHKLDSFNMDFERWSDVAAFTFLVDRVGIYQLRSFQECSYAPMARAVPLMITEENLHIGFGFNAMKRLVAEDKAEAQAALEKWYPRALDMFGHTGSPGSELAVRLGIKRWRNEESRKMYIEEVRELVEKLELDLPPEEHGRRVL